MLVYVVLVLYDVLLGSMVVIVECIVEIEGLIYEDEIIVCVCDLWNL